MESDCAIFCKDNPQTRTALKRVLNYKDKSMDWSCLGKFLLFRDKLLFFSVIACKITSLGPRLSYLMS